MKRWSVPAIAVLVLSSPIFARAQTESPPAPPTPPAAPAPPAEPTKKTAGGIDVVGQLTLGDLEKKGLFGFGGLLRFEYALSPKLTLTGRAGYIWHPKKNDISTFWVVPVLAGAKFTVFGPLFVAGELGFVHARVKETTGGIFYGPDDSEHFGMTLGAGYRWRQLDARVSLHLLDLGAPSDWTALAFSLGYTYWFM